MFGWRKTSASRSAIWHRGMAAQRQRIISMVWHSRGGISAAGINGGARQHVGCSGGGGVARSGWHLAARQRKISIAAWRTGRRGDGATRQHRAVMTLVTTCRHRRGKRERISAFLADTAAPALRCMHLFACAQRRLLSVHRAGAICGDRRWRRGTGGGEICFVT